MCRPGAQLRKRAAAEAVSISARAFAATAGHIPKEYDERRRLSERAVGFRRHGRRRGHRRREAAPSPWFVLRGVFRGGSELGVAPRRVTVFMNRPEEGTESLGKIRRKMNS